MNPQVHGLNKLQRLVFVTFGLAVFLLGAWAVFETENAVGSAALIGVGALLIVVGIVGQIAGLKIGDYEIMLTSEARESIRALADEQIRHGLDLRQEGRIEASEGRLHLANELLSVSDEPTLVEVSEKSTSRPRSISSADLFHLAQSYEHAILTTIVSIVERLEIGRAVTSDRSRDRGADLVIDTPSGVIVVEIKISHVGGRSMADLGERAVTQAFSFVRESPRSAALAVIAGAVSDVGESGVVIAREPGSRIVVWSPEDTSSDQALESALISLAQFLRHGNDFR